jgi:hypothetical protein
MALYLVTWPRDTSSRVQPYDDDTVEVRLSGVQVQVILIRMWDLSAHAPSIGDRTFARRVYDQVADVVDSAAGPLKRLCPSSDRPGRPGRPGRSRPALSTASRVKARAGGTRGSCRRRCGL